MIGAGAGTGLSAKCAEAGGVDLIVILQLRPLPHGRARVARRVMPYGDANEIVVDMAREVLPVVRDVPVLAGVCGTDPFRLMHVFMRELIDIGFSGVQNFPTVGLIDGLFRVNLEETGMGYGLEVDRSASRTRWICSPRRTCSTREARAMTEAGADMLVAAHGAHDQGTIGAQRRKTLDDCVVLVQAIADAAERVRPEIIVLCHGGPIAEPEDALHARARAG